MTCAANAAQNIKKCIRRCGLEVDDVVLEQLASSHAILTEDEKQLGVALVDIGGGTSDIAIFTEGAIRHTGVIPIAGDQVTNDIAMALRTPTPHAEELKIKFNLLMSVFSDQQNKMTFKYREQKYDLIFLKQEPSQTIKLYAKNEED